MYKACMQDVTLVYIHIGRRDMQRGTYKNHHLECMLEMDRSALTCNACWDFSPRVDGIHIAEL